MKEHQNGWERLIETIAAFGTTIIASATRKLPSPRGHAEASSATDEQEQGVLQVSVSIVRAELETPEGDKIERRAYEKGQRKRDATRLWIEGGGLAAVIGAGFLAWSNVGLLQGQIDQSVRQFHQSQWSTLNSTRNAERAYVVVENAGLMVPLKVGSPVVVQLLIRNAGRTPAISVKLAGNVYFLKVDGSSPWPTPTKVEMAADIGPGQVDRGGVRRSDDTTNALINLTPDEYDFLRIPNSPKSLFAIGSLAYDDVFRALLDPLPPQPLTTFCVFYATGGGPGEVAGSFQPCLKGTRMVR
jgi:hypothetical protein